LKLKPCSDSPTSPWPTVRRR